MTPAALSIVQQLTAARDTAANLYGEQYEANLKPFREAIERIQAANKAKPIAQSCMDLIKAVDAHGTQGDMLCAMAACYEAMAAGGGEMTIFRSTPAIFSADRVRAGGASPGTVEPAGNSKGDRS